MLDTSDDLVGCNEVVGNSAQRRESSVEDRITILRLCGLLTFAGDAIQ